MKMKIGTVAVCSLGCLGLITKDEPQSVTYRICDYCKGSVSGADLDDGCTCESGTAYVGIHLSSRIAPIGSPWSSRNPRVIGHIDQFVPEA